MACSSWTWKRKHCHQSGRVVEASARKNVVARVEQETARFLTGGRMEDMNASETNESRLWKILEKNELVDLSQFHKPSFFDEIPLYTRLADVSFLPHDKADLVLLRFALKFMKAVISYEEHDTPYFAAITVHEFAPGEPIVPQLFVWSDPAFELFARLELE